MKHNEKCFKTNWEKPIWRSSFTFLNQIYTRQASQLRQLTVIYICDQNVQEKRKKENSLNLIILINFMILNSLTFTWQNNYPEQP